MKKTIVTLLTLLTLLCVLALGTFANAQGNTSTIKYGQTVSATFEKDSMMTRQPYTFEGTKGDKITIQVVSTGLPLSVMLRNEATKDIMESTQKAATSIKISVALPQTGTYLIVVDASTSDGGDYKLTLQGPGATAAKTSTPTAKATTSTKSTPTPKATTSSKVTPTPKATTASNQNINLEGTYDVSGTNPDGSTYSGTLTITASGDVYNLEWSIDSTIAGIGILDENVLSVASGDNCNVFSFKKGTSGMIDGQWTAMGSDQLASESLIAKKAQADLTGTYTVSGTDLKNADYTGGLTIKAVGKTLQFLWTFSSSKDEGVGIQPTPDGVISVASGSDKCLVTQYTVDGDGNLDGAWASFSNGKLGTETATKSTK